MNAQSMGRNKSKTSAKSDKSKWNNETKQGKSTKARRKTHEVKDLRSPEMKVVKCHIGQPRLPIFNRTSYDYKTTMAINNQIESKLLMEQQTSNVGMTMSKIHRTEKPKAQWEADYAYTLRSRPRGLLSSQPVKSYRQAKRTPAYSLPGFSLQRCCLTKTTKSTKILR